MKKIIFSLALAMASFLAIGQTPTVSISDHNGNVDDALIDCTYNFIPPQRIQLTATYPSLQSTTDYTAATVPYGLIGNLSDGNPVAITGDDVWSASVPIGFTFCFYGNSYTSLNVSDNGIVRFGYNPSTPEGSFSSITNTTPSPSLIRNAIFGGFQDYIMAPVGFGCATGEDCGSISYYTTGTAPFRQMVVNFNGLNYFNCLGANAIKAYFQVVLFETTNAIEIHVQDKPLPCLGNSSANGNGNSLIGLNNANGTLGVAAPGRNTSEFAVSNESYAFTPSGASATSIVWTNQFGVNIGTSNPIEVIPPQADTFYTATVTYNTCIPRQIQGVFTITYDPSFPASPDIVQNICDAVAPFPNEVYDVEALVTPIGSEVISFHGSQLEADNNLNPLANMSTYNLTTAVTTLYYRRTLGTCYSTGRITINLYQTPDLNDVTLYYCDENNDNVENNIYLPGLTSQIAGYTSSWMSVRYFQNLANATANVNPITYINLTNPPGFYDVYVRVYNTAHPECFDIITMRLELLPRLVLDVPTVACIPDTNFDLNEIFDLTSIPITASVGPINPADLQLTYYTSLANANNQTNAIGNPNAFNVSIPQGQTETTIYVVANASGYCFGVVPVTLTFCIADGGDGGGGGGGGNGGFGGLGACLETGDVIPTFDLNVVYTNVMQAVPVNPVPAAVGFYTTLLGAQTADAAVLLTPAEVSSYTPVAPYSEIWVRFIDANGIVGIKRIIVPLKYKRHEIIEYEICDVFNDDTEFIDLENSPVPVSYLQAIRNDNLGETVTAYASMADYLTNSNPITTITLNGPLTTVYVKVSSYGCDSDYTLNFNLKPYDIKTPIVTQVCDIDADGVEVFDLTTLLPTVDVTGYTTPVLTLHPTLNDAYLNTNGIANATTYNVTTTTTVFVRVEETAVLPPNTPVVCPAIQEFQFGFYDSVDVNPIGTQEYCDLDDDNQVVLGNLNSLVTAIVIENPSQPIIRRLYTNLLAAQTSDAVYEILPDWDLFTYDTTILGTSGTLYLQLTNSVTGCTRIVPIAIEIRTLPLSVTTTVNQCDFDNDNSEAIGDFQVFNAQIIPVNIVLYTFQYFETLADATAGTPELPVGFIVQDGSVVYVRIQSGLNPGCSRVFPIEIDFQPTPLVTSISPLVCDNLGNGFETINLFSFQSQLVTSMTGLTFQYYTSLANLQNNINALSNANVTNFNAIFNSSNVAQTVYVKVIDNTTQCYAVATITPERLPLIDAYDAVQFSCDISTTNQLQAIFDLEASVPRVGTEGMISNPNDYTISFHTSNANAVNNVAAIVTTTNYTVVANQTTAIYVRFQDNITGCFTIKVLELQIYNLPKFVNSVYDICDGNLDGIYVLDLAELNGTVVEDPTPFTFQYFNSEADGLAGINPITNTTNYTIPLADFPKTIYVKGTNLNNCSKVKAVIIGLVPNVPMLTNAVTLTECDPNNDGVAIFDLTDATSLLTNATGVSFAYFTSLSDMQNNTNALVNPNNYENAGPNPNVVYVRLSRTNNCDTYATVTLNPFYEAYDFPALTQFCDNNADGTETIDLGATVYGILNMYAPASLDLQFYTSYADAVANTNSIPSVYTFTNFTTPVFVRITNVATSCPIIKQLEYAFYAPIVLTPHTVQLCDLDRNTTEIINLSTYFSNLNANATNYTITSYLTQNGAENEVVAELISNSNYLQTVANQTYWLRFEDVAGCYSVTSVAIEIVPYPNPLTQPLKIELCDVTGNHDLVEIFDITQNETYIRNGNSTWNITYYETFQDAELALNPIANPAAYPSATTSVWMRVVTTPISTLTSCAVLIEQELEVIPLPTPRTDPPKILLCDDNLTGDLQESFNLTQNINYIRNGNATAVVSYHTSLNEAQLGINPIASVTNYFSGTTSIWIRVQSDVATTLQNCAIVVEQEIEVVAKPTNLVTNLPALIACDDTNAGNLTEAFDLSLNTTLMLNGNTYQVSYHELATDAQTGLNPILNFTNYETGSTTIYVRIITLPVSALTTCAVVIPQTIIVNPLPAVVPVTPYLSCIINTSGEAEFDLETKTAAILNGQNPNQFWVSYHLTENEAKLRTNPINSPYVSVSTTIWASILNTQTNCIATVSIALVTENAVFAVAPSPLAICDEDGVNDGFHVFDFNPLVPSVLGSQNGNSDISIHFYASEMDLWSDQPITDISNYINVSSPQTIYVKVVDESTQNKCMATTSFDISVPMLPNPTPQDGFICTDPLNNQLISTFTIDSGLDSNAYTFQWYQESTLLPNATGPILEVSQGGNYFVVATDVITGCVSEPAGSTVIVSQPAAASVKVEYSFEDNIRLIVTTIGNGVYAYQLNNEPVQASNIFQNVSAGMYTITVYDTNGCEPVTLEAIVLDYDKFFTPNGDGYNDTWHIRGIQNQPNAKVYIYDRYGKFLKELVPDKEGWDGTYNGHNLPSTDYWFTVYYRENGTDKEFKSHFSMKR